MDNLITLPQSCTETILQDGLALRRSEAFRAMPDRFISGRRLLRGKVTDSFHFVDHPQVELNADEDSVVGFRCDCPDYRLQRCFCVHCAALVGESARLADTCKTSCENADPAEVPTVQTVSAEIPAAKSDCIPKLKDLSYSFCNSQSDLYPGTSRYRIPKKRFTQVFGNVARAETFFSYHKSWGGSCFGFCSTSTFLYQPDSPVTPADFRAGASVPSELKLSDVCQELDLSLLQYIECLQILQYGYNLSLEREINRRDPNCLDRMVQKVQSFQKGEGTPVVMCVWKSPKLDGGHAILPFRVEKLSSTEDRLHIYDPNCPLQTRYATLTKDRSGHYLDWRFPMYNEELYSGKSGSPLSMCAYETYKTAWEHRGTPGADNLLYVPSGVCLRSPEGAVLARVTEDGVESFRDNIFQIAVPEGEGNSQYLLSLPVGAYTLHLEDPQQEALYAQLTGMNYCVSLNTAAREASLCVVEDSRLAVARIPAAGCSYTITILNTEGAEREQLVLAGITGTEGLHLMLKDGQLYAEGLTEQTALYINEEQMPVFRYIAPLIRENPQEEEEQEEELIPNTEVKKEPDEPQG